MWWPSGWPLIPSRLFSHLHLLVAAQAGLEFVCVFGHDELAVLRRSVKRPRLSNVDRGFWVTVEPKGPWPSR